MLHQFPIAH